MRIAVVTPYYQEPREYLQRNLASVREQTYPADHIMVADGFAQDWLDDEPLRHLRLDRGHADYGNTPRAVGAILAASEGYDGVCFLDADNWFSPEHVESCVETLVDSGADYVHTLRQLVRDNGTVMPLGVGEDVTGQHVDTNCYCLSRGAFHTLSRWALMPKQMASLGDRFYLQSLRKEGLSSAGTGRKTVNYLCTWAPMYRAIGEQPPAFAKEYIDGQAVGHWLAGLDARERVLASRLSGLPI